MALVKNSSIRNVGYDPIDEDHAEFVHFLNQLDVVGDADFPALFQKLHEHTEQHFDYENQLMAQFAFPAESEHRGEHQRLLAEFRQFKAGVDAGMVSLGRAFVKERLPKWFELHTATMDTALASHIRTQ